MLFRSVEGTVGITVDNLSGGHHVNSFSLVDLAAVGEVLGTSADGDQRHGHHQSQYQRKELLHSGFSSFKDLAVKSRHVFANVIRSAVSGAHTVASRNPYLCRNRLSIRRSQAQFKGKNPRCLSFLEPFNSIEKRHTTLPMSHVLPS